MYKRIATDDFAQIPRRPDFSQAFAHSRKLQLRALIVALLSMRNQSQQAMLEGFIASVRDSEFLQRGGFARTIAKARNRHYLPAMASINELVVRRCARCHINLLRAADCKMEFAIQAVILPDAD